MPAQQIFPHPDRRGPLTHEFAVGPRWAVQRRNSIVGNLVLLLGNFMHIGPCPPTVSPIKDHLPLVRHIA